MKIPINFCHEHLAGGLTRVFLWALPKPKKDHGFLEVCHTVDGSEIPRYVQELRLVVGFSHYLQGFSTIPGGFLTGFLNHQQVCSLHSSRGRDFTGFFS